MLVEIKVPTPGESITEVEIGKWLVSDDDFVEKGQEVAEIESDKATLTLSAAENGQIKILVQEGERVAVGAVACIINTDSVSESKPVKEVIASELFAKSTEVAEKKSDIVPAADDHMKSEESKIKITSVARKMMEEHQLSIDDVLTA